MKNKMTNIDAKKAYINFVCINVIPEIYIDEYWDYYINEYNLQDEWNSFLKDFTDGGFTYTTFEESFFDLLYNGCNKINSLFNKEQSKKYDELLNNATPKIPITPLKDILEGEYVSVDIHNSADQALKLLGIQETTEEIVNNKFSKYKKIRMSIYNYNHNIPRLYQIYSDVLVENVYQSDDPVIKYMNDNLESPIKMGGDNFMYRIPDGKNVDDILGDHSYGDITYHIYYSKVKQLSIFGTKIIFIIHYDKNKIKSIEIYNSKNYPLPLNHYPFIYKIAMGEELNEKDLAIGYEDRIFFHFDKSELI